MPDNGSRPASACIIRDACEEHGVAESDGNVSADRFTVTFARPEAATPQVTPQTKRLVSEMRAEMNRSEVMAELGLTDRNHFPASCIRPALEASSVEMTIPDRLRSSAQRYRLTELEERFRNHLGQTETD